MNKTNRNSKRNTQQIDNFIFTGLSNEIYFWLFLYIFNKIYPNKLIKIEYIYTHARLTTDTKKQQQQQHPN